MIGIVAVSHSARLAEATAELAAQMVPKGGVPLRLAGGAGTEADGTPILGTDAMLVATAIDELAPDTDGVIVIMDLGSAVMSAEMALEFRTSDVPVRLVPAPFVEGVLAASVSAAGGASLDAVAQEAESALLAKTAVLAPAPPSAAPEEKPNPESEIVRRVPVLNSLGIHARPAALIVGAAQGDRSVRLRALPGGAEASAASLTQLLVLSAAKGDEVELLGPVASEQAIDRIAALFHDGFGELES
ncbi:dihydroxyacetone kinase phosphoryl donor subunit DhaM [Microbacterium amylolyticum]|uniref:Phosphocarrier protein HPr n=1 Tax=Microbacterium amylolyticum TaxID=936337 RepID=A0ABS4ZI29_9MICO|nr:dihydroxyacetone kinase phosphoryl donor subunit DhaM [Microbacterium amylolyticum]MBP2436862.1 dihydroxyacetone kinase phosphotransfer subunit [Microbacterium amylolyticum]